MPQDLCQHSTSRSDLTHPGLPCILSCPKKPSCPHAGSGKAVICQHRQTWSCHPANIKQHHHNTMSHTAPYRTTPASHTASSTRTVSPTSWCHLRAGGWPVVPGCRSADLPMLTCSSSPQSPCWSSASITYSPSMQPTAREQGTGRLVLPKLAPGSRMGCLPTTPGPLQHHHT